MGLESGHATTAQNLPTAELNASFVCPPPSSRIASCGTYRLRLALIMTEALADIEASLAKTMLVDRHRLRQQWRAIRDAATAGLDDCRTLIESESATIVCLTNRVGPNFKRISLVLVSEANNVDSAFPSWHLTIRCLLCSAKMRSPPRFASIR